MTDRFSNWDRYYSNFKATNDPQKALNWLKYQLWAKKRRDQALALHARHQAALSLHPAAGEASSKNIKP